MSRGQPLEPQPPRQPLYQAQASVQWTHPVASPPAPELEQPGRLASEAPLHHSRTAAQRPEPQVAVGQEAVPTAHRTSELSGP
jgi:hypothetical protein